MASMINAWQATIVKRVAELAQPHCEFLLLTTGEFSQYHRRPRLLARSTAGACLDLAFRDDRYVQTSGALMLPGGGWADRPGGNIQRQILRLFNPDGLRVRWAMPKPLPVWAGMEPERAADEAWEQLRERFYGHE